MIGYDRFVRFGVLDIAAAAAFALVALLPSPARPIRGLVSKDLASLAPRIAEAQADMARDPRDADAAARLADLLVRVRQTDWAVRVAARAAATPSPERWRAMVAVSAAHADRLEIPLAYEWARKALVACEEKDTDCPEFERGRLAMYERALEAAYQSGVDPKINPKGMNEAVEKAVPLIRMGKKR